MTMQISHRRAPEIIVENVHQRIHSQDVLVEDNSWNVIVNKLAMQTVEIADERHAAHKRIMRPGRFCPAAGQFLLPHSFFIFTFNYFILVEFTFYLQQEIKSVIDLISSQG